MTARVFVSYRRDDSKHAAGRLGERLDERFRLFMDVDQIQGGADFTAVVRKAVDQTDVLLAVIGSQWLTLTAENGGRRIDQPGDWVAEEIGTALRRGTPVIPVLVDGARMPTRGQLPPPLADLANRQAMRIAHESFAADSARLIQTIEGMVSTAKPQSVNLWKDPDYPEARAAFLRGLWPAAIEGFERVLRRHPRHQNVLEQLEEARRNQRLLDLDDTAEHAAQAGRWGEAVDALEAIVALQPSDDVTDRLASARLKLQIAELQNDVRALAATGDWAAVLAADTKLAGLDPEAGDPDSLATKARAELLEAELRALYTQGVKQLDEHEWTGAEATFAELLDRRSGYHDAEELLALARRQGTPKEEHKSPPVSPAREPAPVDSSILPGEVRRPLATRNPKPSVGAGSPPLVIHEVEGLHDEAGHPATPIVRRRKIDSPWVPAIGIVAVVLLILTVIGIQSVGGNKPNSSTGAVTPASTTYSPSPTPSQSELSSWTPDHQKLYGQVPNSFDDSCEPLDITDAALQPKLVAALRCDPGSSGTPDYLDYLQYPTKSAMESAFNKYVGNLGSYDCDTRAGVGTWTFHSTPDKPQGKLACFKRGSVRLNVWDDIDSHILSRAGSKTMSYSKLQTWWTKGPSW